MQIPFLKKYNNLSEPVKASLWYTVCNVLNKGLALLSTPIFTRILTEEQFGAFSIFYSWYNIFFIFTSLNVFMGSYNKALVHNEEDRAALTSSFLGLTTTLTLAWCAIYLINPPFFNGFLDLSTPLVLAMFVELLTTPALELWAAKERFDYKYRNFVIISLLRSVLSIGLGVAAVLLISEFKLEARVYSDVFAKSIFSLVLMIGIFIKGKTFFHKAYWKMALSFNIPLIPHYLSNYILTQSDRIMIGKMVGEAQAAHYSVAYTISTVIMLIVSAVNGSLTPYIYKKLKAEKSADIKKNMNPIIIMMAALSMLTMVFAPEIITIFAGKNYANAIYVVPPVAASIFFVFLYSLFSTIEYYHQKTIRIAVATSFAALLNIGLNFLLIPRFGYYAAGYTTLISYIVLSLLHYIFYRLVIKQTGEARMYDEKCIIIVSAVLLAITAFIAVTYPYAIVRYLFVAVLAILAIFFRKKLLSVLKTIKTKD